MSIDLATIGAESLLPPDDSGYGFDNIADVLSVSPLLLERYLSAARKVSTAAVAADAAVRPATQIYRVNKQTRQDDRMSEDLPFASRGGLAVRHYFPLDGEYVIKIHMLRTYEGKIRGLDDANQLELRVNRALVKRLSIGGGPAGNGEPAAGGGDTPAPQVRRPRDRSVRPQATPYLMGADAGLEYRLPARAGEAIIGVSYVRKPSIPEGMLLPIYPVTSYEYAGDTSVLAGVEAIEILGPYKAQVPAETASRRKVLLCSPAGTPDEMRCANTILSALARQAYRRPVTAEDLVPLIRLYEEGRSQGSFETGIQQALQRILASPDFLFRFEYDPADLRPGAAYRISDLDLASRLSFFLWSSIPDEPLLEAAIRGELGQPGGLEHHVRRMMSDVRARALITNFGGQWLQIRNVRLSTPDPYAFPDFDENLRDAMERETSLFLQSQFAEDRSVLDLLTANYTFLNERLARHYGLSNVYGSHFRRVTVSDDDRKGLLGHAALLMVTSYPNRTAPTIRGKWLLENFLGAPPPPPPPNVPALADDSGGVAVRSVRERLERHRANPVCASCHARMDPLGFALENFDAIGAWRTREADAESTLPESTGRFELCRAGGLRQVLLDHREEFVTTIAERLLTYALGRGVEHYDMPAIRSIVRDAATQDYRWSSLVSGIVASQPFQMRTSGASPPAAIAAR